jgi:mediator of RNA polymerase II transcription subunit 22
MQQQQKLNQNSTLNTYEKKVKEDVAVIYDNLYEILKILKSDDENGLSKMCQSEVDSYQFEIRTSNMIKATESLSKIVSDLKDLVILNDFKSINSQISSQSMFFKQKEDEIDKNLLSLKENIIPLLQELQPEYYASSFK